MIPPYLALPFVKITEIPIGFLHIKVWGLFVALGMLAGLYVSSLEAKRRKIPFDTIIDFFIWIFVGSMIGARLLYVFLFWEHFIDEPFKILFFWEGGMVFYGGVIGALIAIFSLLKRHKIAFWKLADTMAPGLAIGTFLGRIGCYLTGLHIGSKTDFFLASSYFGELRHEPSLYLSLNGLVLFSVLWFLRKKFQQQGMLAWITILWYSVSRFFLDFLRASDLPGQLSDPRFFGLTISQYLSLLFLIIFIPYGIKKFYR